MTSVCVFVSQKWHYRVDFEDIIAQEYLLFGVTRSRKVNVGLQHLLCPWLHLAWTFSLRGHPALQLLTCRCSDIFSPGWGKMMQYISGETETEEWLIYGIALPRFLRSCRLTFMSPLRSQFLEILGVSSAWEDKIMPQRNWHCGCST